jgi:CelD/BcsL family acetyltransferase involved in cellulose biosynthesis
MLLGWEVLESAEAVDSSTVRQWDDLAVRLGKPYCAPAWLLAWLHQAPAGIRLRIIVVRDEGRLVAVAPFYATRWRLGLWTWALMGAETMTRIEPLAEPELLQPAADAIRDALAAAEPTPARIHLEGLSEDSPWPELLTRRAAGRAAAWSAAEGQVAAPTITLDVDCVDDFLGRRSTNFRQQMRRSRRKLDTDGGEFRIANTPEELERALPEFIRLHHARWDHRGGSMSLRPASDRMLLDAGLALGPERFRLVSLVVDGKTVNSQLFVAAGREIGYWNGGWDENYARYKPSLVTLVEEIRASIDGGYERFDLGPGAQDYKYRFTDTEDRLRWHTVIPRGRLYPLARMAYAPRQARHSAARLLTREQKARLRQLIRRPPH